MTPAAARHIPRPSIVPSEECSKVIRDIIRGACDPVPSKETGDARPRSRKM